MDEGFSFQMPEVQFAFLFLFTSLSWSSKTGAAVQTGKKWICRISLYQQFDEINNVGKIFVSHVFPTVPVSYSAPPQDHAAYPAPW